MSKKIDPNKLILGIKKEIRKENVFPVPENRIETVVKKIHFENSKQSTQDETTEPTKRTTLDIPRSLHKQICQRALDKDMSLKDYFLALVNKDLKNV